MVNAIFFEARKLQLYATLHFIAFPPARLIHILVCFLPEHRRNIVKLICKTKIFSEISPQTMVFLLHFYVIGRSVLPLDVDRASFIPYPTAFPYGNGMVLHFYQQQESSTTKTVHKVINKGLKAYV